MDKIVSKSKYNRKDHQNFYLFHMFHRSFFTYFILALCIFVIVWSIIQTINLLPDAQDNLNQIFLIWGFAAFTVLLIPFLMIRRVNDVVKNETEERKTSIDTIEVTKVKITRSNDKLPGKVVISWKQVECICESKDYVYIYTGSDQGIFLVKKDIVEGDCELLKKIAEYCMKKNRKGKVKYKKYFRDRKNVK